MEQFNNCNEFLEYFEKSKNNFPMIVDYLEKDDCYIDDDWIIWYSIIQNNIPIAFLAERKIPLFDNSKHIAVFEVNSDLRKCGYGTQIINNYLIKNPNVSLYSSDENKSFYEFLGFEKANKPYLYTRGIL